MLMGRRARLALVLALLGALLAILPAAPLAATGPVTYVVINTLDNVNDANCAVGQLHAAPGGQRLERQRPRRGQPERDHLRQPADRRAITLTAASGGTLTLSTSVAITGPGANLLAVDGNHATTVFTVNGGATATISGLTIRNGKGAAGTTGATAPTASSPGARAAPGASAARAARAGSSIAGR